MIFLYIKVMETDILSVWFHSGYMRNSSQDMDVPGKLRALLSKCSECTMLRSNRRAAVYPHLKYFPLAVNQPGEDRRSWCDTANRAVSSVSGTDAGLRSSVTFFFWLHLRDAGKPSRKRAKLYQS